MSKMRDADMPLVERIGAAIERIAHGQAAMRVPVEATDPDVVLADCQREIERLRAALKTCVWALRQPLDGWKGECERKALDEARDALKEQR